MSEVLEARSRVARGFIPVPKGVEVKVDGQNFSAKGKVGQLDFAVHNAIRVELGQADDDQGQALRVVPLDVSKTTNALAGTTAAVVRNMLHGVNEGFERKLELRGVGYRAQLKGKVLNLTLGLSHPVDYTPLEGVTLECPSQTEIVIKGADKQKVGQVAAEIRRFRPPEQYKGKGIRYADERISLKETKKK